MTSAPAVTDVTELLPDVSASEVVVAVCARTDRLVTAAIHTRSKLLRMWSRRSKLNGRFVDFDSVSAAINSPRIANLAFAGMPTEDY
jgi:hypothetical protein